MSSLAQEESVQIQEEIDTLLSTTVPSLLLPPSQTSHLNALLEFKSGVGGAESSLFLTELIRMYTRYASAQNWTTSVLSKNELDAGGTKDAILEITSKGKKNDAGVYDTLRWESGVHRVQRVPATDSQSRIHTSTVAIVVLPLMEEDAEAQTSEPLYSLDDVKIEVMRSRGAGGQHVNKTESAVRLTHLPTGITVSMQDERSQHTVSTLLSIRNALNYSQNKRRAFQILSSRLLDLKLTREMAERRATRNNLVRSVDRSEKIRTYNYAQVGYPRSRVLLRLHVTSRNE
jgi:peptide chain release factor 1